jgi:uncharacterized protein
MQAPALIIFAKQPVVGEVKTRLLPRYTAAQAAAIAAALIEHTVELVSSIWRGPVYLAAAPSADHPLLAALSRRYPITLSSQARGDLGQRMHTALMHACRAHGAAAVIGCDVPHCPPAVVAQAQVLLKEGKNVLGPSDDGGYYLIGLTQPYATLFEGIEWGESSVLETTLARARDISLDFELLPCLRDIDTADDLRAAADTFELLRPFVIPDDRPRHR